MLIMKMAKASKEEIDDANELSNRIDSLLDYSVYGDDPEEPVEHDDDKIDQRVGALVRKYYERHGGLFRIVFGYAVLVDSVCDPDADTLEWKKDLAEKLVEGA
jgi:hypothetical protein